jgi:hypothetical protein
MSGFPITVSNPLFSKTIMTMCWKYGTEATAPPELAMAGVGAQETSNTTTSKQEKKRFTSPPSWVLVHYLSGGRQTTPLYFLNPAHATNETVLVK